MSEWWGNLFIGHHQRTLYDVLHLLLKNPNELISQTWSIISFRLRTTRLTGQRNHSRGKCVIVSLAMFRCKCINTSLAMYHCRCIIVNVSLQIYLCTIGNVSMYHWKCINASLAMKITTVCLYWYWGHCYCPCYIKVVIVIRLCCCYSHRAIDNNVKDHAFICYF